MLPQHSSKVRTSSYVLIACCFPDWVHSPRFSLGCGRVHVQGCRDGHFVLASRLGSLTTVLTWLRSRACAGMQGLALLALVVVAPSGSVQGITWNCEHCCPICGFAAQVAAEEAVLCPPLAIAAAMGSAPNSTRQTATATRHEVNPLTFEK